MKADVILGRGNRPNAAKGLMAGLIGGLVASWVMNQFQAAASKIGGKIAQNESGRKPQSARGSQSAEERQQSQGGGGDSATVKTAAAIAGEFGAELPPERKEMAGSLVHYAYGTCVGGVYGLLAERYTPPRSGFGTLFGTALWLGSDEIAIPALRLGKLPQEYPLKTHAMALAAHIVYGVTTEVVRRGLRTGYLS
jgi:uncharacterized membrane protein YeaQ/YmgE (transglycosylase-associated protein family)